MNLFLSVLSDLASFRFCTLQLFGKSGKRFYEGDWPPKFLLDFQCSEFLKIRLLSSSEIVKNFYYLPFYRDQWQLKLLPLPSVCVLQTNKTLVDKMFAAPSSYRIETWFIPSSRVVISCSVHSNYRFYSFNG